MRAQAFFDELQGHCVFTRTRGELKERGLRLKSAPGNLGCDRMTVGGEGACLDQHARAPSLRAVEARKHQMQVHRERVHRHDFVGSRARQRRKPGGEVLVIGHPGAARALVTLHPKVRPVIELLGDDLTCGERQESEGVAAQVGERGALRILRQGKACAKGAQRVGGIARLR